MLAGRDSAAPPTDAELAAFYAEGVRVYGGYIKLGNDGIYEGWAKADFDRVKAHGMVPIAYMSGWDDPATAKADAAAWGVLGALDVENGIRGDGPWVQPFLDATGFGLYGNGSVHNGRRAAFHVLAGYPGGNPAPATWYTPYAPRPAGLCAWQWKGTHAEYGVGVDSSWWDDGISGRFGAAGGSVTGGDMLTFSEKRAFAREGYLAAFDREPESDAALDGWANQIKDDGSNVDAIVAAIADSAEGVADLAKMRAVRDAGPAQPGPAGPQGIPGKDGAPGPQGPAGPPADTTAVTQSIGQKIIAAFKAAFGL